MNISSRRGVYIVGRRVFEFFQKNQLSSKLIKTFLFSIRRSGK